MAEWIGYAVQTSEFKEALEQNSSATTVAIINKTRFSALELPVAPLPEQHRIVEAIESYLTRLDDAVATLERVERNLKRYRASVLKAAVKGRLVPTEAELAQKEDRDYEPASVLLERILNERRRRWIEEAAEKGRGKEEGKAKTAGKPWTAEDNAEALENERVKAVKKYKEPAAPDTELLPELPDGWCWASVDQTITIIDYRGRTPPYAEDGIPHLRSSNVRDGRIHWAGLRYVTEETFDTFMTRGLPVEGDLLFTTEAPMGEVAFVPNTRFSLAQRIMILSPARDCLRPRFLYLQIQSSAFQNRIRFRKTGSGVTGISSRNFKPAGIAIAPMSEQARIADEVESLLSNVESMAVVAETSGLRCQRLRQSILKWAFEGKLVDQDTNDEPASVLLERINAERAAMEAKNNRKGSSRRKAK